MNKECKISCKECHLYERTMLIFSILLKLTSVLPRGSTLILHLKLKGREYILFFQRK